MSRTLDTIEMEAWRRAAEAQHQLSAITASMKALNNDWMDHPIKMWRLGKERREAQRRYDRAMRTADSAMFARHGVYWAAP